VILTEKYPKVIKQVLRLGFNMYMVCTL